MSVLDQGRCPVCGEWLQVKKLSCPACQAEFPINKPLSPFDRLSPEESEFLKTFLSCHGNLKEVQNQWNISYPTAKKKLDELLIALELAQPEEVPDMKLNFLRKTNEQSVKASDIIRNKLYENGGQVTIYSARGNAYTFVAHTDGKTFRSNGLPHPSTPPAYYSFEVFDVIVDLLLSQGGRARKGNGRNYKLGYGDCTEDTIVGAIAVHCAHKHKGDSVFDPVFVLAAVLEWANIAHNGRGYLELTADYLAKCSGYHD
ncbi:MAG: DUF2089 family protein [Eubacteriales bacterium]|jgi:hypothetical protein